MNLMVKYEAPLVHIKVVIPHSLDEIEGSDEIKYYKTMSLVTCESLFTLIEPLSNFISAEELILGKLSKDYY